MFGSPHAPLPRTTTDMVFEQLHADILTLRLLPGSKISEAEIAASLGVSRQPVRDAFNRLGNLGLLSIRPQRATLVRGFSLSKIANARFIRLAVEIEVIRQACGLWDDAKSQILNDNMAQQRAAQTAGQTDLFHELDYEFHRLICEQGGQPLAFDTITWCKQQVDRICLLSLGQATEVAELISDHETLVDALANRNLAEAEAITRHHLSRLDKVIEDIHDTHAEYFE